MVFCLYIDNNYFSEMFCQWSKREKMKKGIVFNVDIFVVIFCLGYIDMLVVCDVGLLVFCSSMCIDMVLIQGVFLFMQVLEVVMMEMQVEVVVIVEEIKIYNLQFYVMLFIYFEQLQQYQGNIIEICYISYEQFKK